MADVEELVEQAEMVLWSRRWCRYGDSTKAWRFMLNGWGIAA
jgi:hypothetical protein